MPKRMDRAIQTRLHNAASFRLLLCGLRCRTRRSSTTARRMKALKATQRRGVPIVGERILLRSDYVRIDAVQIGQFDARGAAGFDGYGNIPAEARVARIGVEIEGADPVVAGEQSGEGGTAVEVGVGFGHEVFGLRDLWRCAQN